MELRPNPGSSMSMSDAAAFPMPASFLRDHWQGHRRVTRRVIAAFPERDLFHYSAGGMRPFAAMAFEVYVCSASCLPDAAKIGSLPVP